MHRLPQPTLLYHPLLLHHNRICSRLLRLLLLPVEQHLVHCFAHFVGLFPTCRALSRPVDRQPAAERDVHDLSDVCVRVYRADDHRFQPLPLGFNLDRQDRARDPEE